MLPTTVIQWACLFQNNKQTNKTQDNLSLFCFPDIIPYLYPIQPLFDPKKYKKKIHSPLFKKKKKSVLCKSLILLMETFAVVVVALTVTLSIRTNLKGLRPIFHMILERSSLSLELFIFFLWKNKQN